MLKKKGSGDWVSIAVLGIYAAGFTTGCDVGKI